MKKLLFILLLSISIFADLPQVTKPYSMIAGGAAKASEVDANWDSSYFRINMLVDTVNRLNTSISTDTAIIDSAAIVKAAIDTLTGDTVYYTFLGSQKTRIDTILSAPYIDTIISDSVHASYLKSNRGRIDTAIIDSASIIKANIDTILSCDTAHILALKANSFNLDTLTADTAYIGYLQVDSINILDTGSFTATLTGCTTSPTGTCFYTKVGNVVALELPLVNGTSNTTDASLTGLPERLRMQSASVNAFCLLVDNSISISGTISISTSTAMTLAIPNALFTASGTKGVARTFVTYRIR